MFRRTCNKRGRNKTRRKRGRNKTLILARCLVLAMLFGSYRKLLLQIISNFFLVKLKFAIIE